MLAKTWCLRLHPKVKASFGFLAAGAASCVAVTAATSSPQYLPPRDALRGRVALVTGAGSGIGRAIAVEFAMEGAHVVINDLPGTGRAAETAKLVRDLGQQSLITECDVSDRTSVQEMMQNIIDRFGRLDIVVANAYFSKRQAVLEQEWSDVLRAFEVSQFGAYHTCQLGARTMVEHKQNGTRCHILLITSVNAPYPYLLPGSTAYNMSKASLEALTQNFASALAKHDINVNAIRPGWILTDGERQFMKLDDIKAMATGALPYGVGMPRDIARAAVYLSSDDAAYVTGVVLPVDGGFGVSQRVTNMHEPIERAKHPMHDTI